MYQKITIAGNLGRDPEMRFTPSGQAVTNLNVATSHQYTTNSGEKVKETTWFRVSVWGKSAESCNQYLKKGAKILVEGRVTVDKETGNPRVYEAKDGTWRSSLEITAQTVRFLDSKSDNAAPKEATSYAPEPSEIPF
jgi:single-strand DNA-binding protein